MTTPSKPDLVALAERLEKFQRVLESARRQDNKLISVWSDDPVVVAEAAKALRHLASQPSLYEAGLSDGAIYAAISKQETPADERVEIERLVDGALAATPEEIAASKTLIGPGPSEATPSTAGSVREALDDCQTHRDAWRSALTSMFAPGDPDEEYWQHELRAFDRTFDSLVLSAPVEAPVAVKPLIWRDWTPGTHAYIADSAFGQYSAWFIEPHGVWCGPNDHSGNLHGSSLDAAKAAAQRDYETRIRSALIATPRPLPSVDELARTLRDHIEYGYERADSQKESIIGIDSAATAILTLLGGSAHGR